MAEKSSGVHTSSPTREAARALEGIDFPADRNKIVEYARSRNLSGEALDWLQNLPNEQYTSMADVFKGIGQEDK